MADPTPKPVPIYIAKPRSWLSPRGWIDLLVLLAIAIAAALYAVRQITPHQVAVFDQPSGPLASVGNPPPAPPTPTISTVPPNAGDAPVTVVPAK